MKITREYVTHGLVAVASLAVGGGVSFLVTKHVLETKYEAIIAEEIESAKVYYKKVYKVDEYQSVLSAIENGGVEQPDTEKYDTTTKEIPDDVEVAPTELQTAVKKIKESIEENRNVFKNAKEIEEIDPQEIEDRSPEFPYIISENEFSENDPDHDQTTLTYFEEDDVLADENDGVIEDSDLVVGDDNLSRFGYGSGNHNILFIRNERLETDFEIAKSNGSYAREVLGFIEHSDSRDRIRKFRGDDE